MKPIASLSLDLDDRWSYMKIHGDPGWDALPSYLDMLVPRVLDFLKQRDLRITVFVVGQDAARPQNHALLRRIVGEGHEIGNHSHRHESWMDSYGPDQVETEITAAEEAITAVTGVRPIGYRGPGFSLSRAVLETLARRGYRYDASTLPTFIGPLARAYYFFRADLPEGERSKRRRLFGGLREGLRPVRPYRWELGAQPLLEIPVTTIPGVRTPFHVSYLVWLAAIHPALADAYFRTALRACRAAGFGPSLLLHPLDFLGPEDGVGLSFFPGMDLPAGRKMAWLSSWLADYARTFEVVPMAEHAARLERQRLGTRRPWFPQRPPEEPAASLARPALQDR